MRSYWTYILASKPHGTLYIGVTNGLIRRIEQLACPTKRCQVLG